MLHRLLLLLGVVVSIWAVSTSASASDGLFEINQACGSGPGCFPGDDPGYPITIASSGSYRLTGNVLLDAASGPGGSAIVVAADRVTLDLNGFSVLCATARGPCHVENTHGISGPGRSGTVVRNGQVQGFGGDGVHLEAGVNNLVEKVRSVLNSRAGIRVGPHSAVTDCAATDNGAYGIKAGDGSRIVGNAVHDNGEFQSGQRDGIRCEHNCLVAQNVSSNNVGDGIRVVSGVVRENSVSDSGANGITALGGSLVTGNTMRGSHGCGLRGGGTTGYANNVMTFNNGTVLTDNRAVYAAIATGPNFCGNDTDCTEGAANNCN